jgi:hypothetical protein
VPAALRGRLRNIDEHENVVTQLQAGATTTQREQLLEFAAPFVD